MPFLLLLALLLPSPSFAAESCGIVNGQTVCTTTSGCGIVNGESVCTDPPGCGYVNGLYTCAADASTVFKPTPKPLASAKATQKPGVYDAAVKDGANWMAAWANSLTTEGDTGPLGRFGRWLIQKAIVGYLESKLSALKMAWGIAHSVLEDLGLFTALQNAWSGLGADMLATLNFFGIPAALNILFNAGLTRFVLRFLPF